MDSVALAKRLLPLALDRILLDNLTPEQVREVVLARKSSGSQTLLEASGGVTLERAKKLAGAGVDFISVGALTHSARAIDLALDWKK